MKKTINLLRILLCFMPPYITPIGLHMAGDPNILKLQTPDGANEIFNISNEKKGNCIKLAKNPSNVFYVYVNKNKQAFEEQISKRVEDIDLDDLKATSVTDKKMLAIMHYLLTTTMPNRKFKMTDTAHILSLVDNAFLLRTGRTDKAKYELTKDKWKEYKSKLEESIISKELKVPKSSSSLISVDTKQGDSSSEGE